MSASYADAVYTLYRAGVLTGSDDAGSFRPNTTIRRSEAAAIVTRMADPDLREQFTLTGGDPQPSMTQEQVFEACMPAVFSSPRTMRAASCSAWAAA